MQQRYHSILKPNFHKQASAFSLAPTAPAAKLQFGKGRAGSGRAAPLRMSAGSGNLVSNALALCLRLSK
jgi:hypothetical protein